MLRQIAYALPVLPGLDSLRPKTYAAWPVWKDSTTAEVKFQPLKRKEAARRWQKARRFDRQTHIAGKHGGVIGRTALTVLYTLLFDFLDYATGRLDPSLDAIAAKSGVCRRAVVDALRCLKQLGLLHWQRRSHAAEDGRGGFRLVQETNAYASLPSSQWRGYFEPPPPPPPEPGTWGDHPPLPPVIDQAAADLAAGSSHRTVLAGLECDPGDPLAGALASLGRAILGPQT